MFMEGDRLLYCMLAFYHPYQGQQNCLLLTDLYTFKPVTAAVLTWVMGQRYYQTSKIMPAGIVAGIRYVDLLFVFL